MSTRYGRTIQDREGRSIYVEAFGSTGCVKLFVGESVMEMALDKSEEVEALIDALRLAHNHIWDKLI